MENDILKPDHVSGVSILNLAAGAIPERINEAYQRVIENILDPNTKATGKRSITLTFTFTPDEDRSDLKIDAAVTQKLAPLKPVSTGLFITADENGEAMAVEQLLYGAGQLNFDGGEQPRPVVLKLNK